MNKYKVFLNILSETGQTRRGWVTTVHADSPDEAETAAVFQCMEYGQANKLFPTNPFRYHAWNVEQVPAE